VPKGWSIWQAVYDKENCDRNSAYRPFQSAGGCIDWNARSAKYSFNRITRREEVEGGMAKREEEGEGCVSPDTLVLGNGTRYDMQDLTVGEVVCIDETEGVDWGVEADDGDRLSRGIMGRFRRRWRSLGCRGLDGNRV
jgi:hypothetical protein